MYVENTQTLTDLTEEQRNMVRTLVYNQAENYTSEDIQRVFRLSRQSIAALKAWRTMSEEY